MYIIILCMNIYNIRLNPSCFGIMSLISDNNQGGPLRKLPVYNKITQFGVWAFNAAKRTDSCQRQKLTNRQTKTKTQQRKFPVVVWNRSFCLFGF